MFFLDEKNKAKREQKKISLPAFFHDGTGSEFVRVATPGRPRRASEVPYKKICWEVREDLLQALRDEAGEKGMTVL